jgi:hypothetical protein
MLARPLRGLFVLLIMGAYLSATILAAIPNAVAFEMSSGMTDHREGTSDPMPCKGKMSGCVTELGCLFMVSLPAPDLALSAVVAWLPVIYSGLIEPLDGRSIRPALGPPISRT